MAESDAAFEIGARLQAARKKVRPKLSQAAVAERLGVTGRTVSEWESGRSMPTAPDLAALARTYGVAADYLLGLADVENGLPVGRAVLDVELIRQLDDAADQATADRLLAERGHQTWFEIPQGAVITAVRSAIERTEPVLRRWKHA